jgi:hypothetical protein
MIFDDVIPLLSRRKREASNQNMYDFVFSSLIENRALHVLKN